MLNKEMQMAIYLIDLEAALRSLACWDDFPPSSEALQSQEPFCMDMMEFYQWLQWIFIPRICSILKSKDPLPARCEIAPMAEEWAKARAFSAREVIMVLEKIDALLSVNQGQ